MNTPYLVEKYSNEIVTLEDAREWLRMDIGGYTAEDELINRAIAAAVDMTERDCNVQLGISTFEWITSCRPCEFIDAFQIKTIESIYYQYNGSYTLIAGSDYELERTGELMSRICWINSNNYTRYKHKVRFTAGYAENEVPQSLLNAIRAQIGATFEDRGDGPNEKRTLSDKIKNNFRIGYAG